MNPISNHHLLGDANVYYFTSFLVTVMFLFLVNTVKLAPGLCRLLPVVFCILGECLKYIQSVSWKLKIALMQD